ncbi:protein kinase [Synechocystis sp. LKSZ1]|uniref:protein kinase domain-containing protein n=1 Tax=Synechocystis sp. LKSZ1 TaxID=3144951 RepID=UPI00336C0729
MSLCINPDCEKSKNQEDQGLRLFCTGCGSSLLINDLYRVIQYLGGGGFGITYLVDDCGKKKVLKILHNTDPKAISLFDQEARVLQGLTHPGIPSVEIGGRFDYFPRGGQEPLRCLVMEYIEGETIEDYLSKRDYRPISEQAAVRWLQELIEILALVHSANYFHRDIKPANIMLRSSGQITLIDFGTAREETQTYLQKLSGQGVTGIVSVGYTPHEQAHGHAEYRSDFFSVGRTFVFLLTGKTPDQFQDSLKNGLIWQQEAQSYRQELRDLIDELMRPDVNDRPINAQAILEKLKLLVDFYQTPKTVKVFKSNSSTNSIKPIKSSKLFLNRQITINLDLLLIFSSLATGTIGLTLGLMIPFRNAVKVPVQPRSSPPLKVAPKPTQPAKPKATTPKPTQPAKPKATTPKPAQTDKPKTIQPAKLKATTPKPARTTELKVTQPAKPQSTTPKATQPTKPDATPPKATQPDKPKATPKPE